MYGDLIRELNALRTRTACFRKVALHVHSPDSRDWGRGAAEASRSERARFLAEGGAAEFAAELRQHLELVAITDHMRCGFATEVSAAVAGDNEFQVLPGMEVNFRPEAALGYSRIHLLVIFPEGSPKEAFERLFAGLTDIPPDDASRTGQEEITGISLGEWVDRVHQEGGICIAAHVDNAQGVRWLFRQTSRETLSLFSDAEGADLERENDVPENLKRYLLESELDAIEISHSSDAPHYCWVCELDDKTKWIPTVLKFDAHNVEEFNRPERVTHLKMTRLGFAALKDALAFPDTRIRFPDNLPPLPSPVLLGVEISGEADSFFERVKIAFTENHNCIIGVRGSGKSTLVEALRYTLGYNQTLRELEKLEETIRDLQKATLPGSLIRLVYRTSSGDIRVLEATFDEKSDYVTKVYTVSGEYLDVADVEASGDYPIRLFGWSEIETLGRSPARQRDLLDRLVPELGPTLRKRKEIRNELGASRGTVTKAIGEVRAAFNRSDGEIRRFKEYKADFDKLNTPEVKELFAALDLAQDKRRVLVKVTENAEKLADQLGDPDTLTLRTHLHEILDKGDQALRDWWLGEEMKRLGVIGTEQDVQAAVRQGRERLKTFSELAEQHIKEIDHEIEGVQQKLREEFTADAHKQKVADLRENAEKRLQHVTGLRNEYLKQWNNLVAVLTDRKSIADSLVAVQNEIAGIRAKHCEMVEDRLNQFLPRTMEVSIRFVAAGDTKEFSKAVTPLLAGAHRYKARQLDKVVTRHYTPVEFARMLGRSQLDDLAGKTVPIGETVSEVTIDDVSTVGERTKPFEHDEHADVDVLAANGARLEAILNLQEVEWDDYETILLNGRPVNEQSPGQRSSAMLPLIALVEKTPLVIDQPEDNLDKRLIGRVLVRILAELKEQRQIIVCTHDPNILVGGDAEQVVVLEAESDRRGKVALHGSIDNDDIVHTVIELLEGGAEAFEARRKRYRGRVGGAS